MQFLISVAGFTCKNIRIQLNICKMADKIEKQKKNWYDLIIRMEIYFLKFYYITIQRTEEIEEDNEPDKEIHLMSEWTNEPNP